MKVITEAVCILCVLFTIGVAGGLERGLTTITGALIAWGVAAGIAAVAIAVRAKAG